jgi:crotonobetainyl-CoA:carnitine CoA-transferase CaiB-like acyl-CoA transferase
MILGDLGADVVKVEPIGGDNTRRPTGSGAGFSMFTSHQDEHRGRHRDPRGARSC